jgi:Ca2+-binding RTX toxin-like protein
LVFAGGANADLLIAGSGNETLSGFGSTGANVFFAGAGNDLLAGGAGAETFLAGHGSSTVIGGTGADLYGFINGLGGGSETVLGFSVAKGDHISLQGYGANAAQSALAGATVAGGSTTLTLSDHTSVTFIGVTGLNAANFV